jgi:hypothetical protein
MQSWRPGTKSFRGTLAWLSEWVRFRSDDLPLKAASRTSTAQLYCAKNARVADGEMEPLSYHHEPNDLLTV